jgi:hypothetical protein
VKKHLLSETEVSASGVLGIVLGKDQDSFAQDTHDECRSTDLALLNGFF